MLQFLLNCALVVGQGSFLATTQNIVEPTQMAVLNALANSEPYVPPQKRNDASAAASINPPRWEEVYTGLMCLTGSNELRFECIQVSQSQINNREGTATDPEHLGVCEDWAVSQNYTYLLMYERSKICCGITECTIPALIEADGWSVYAFTSLKFCGTITNNDPRFADNVESEMGNLTMKGEASTNDTCVNVHRITTSSTEDDVDYVCPLNEFMIEPGSNNLRYYLDLRCGNDGEYQNKENIRPCEVVYLNRLTHPFFPWASRLPTQIVWFAAVLFHRYFYYIVHCEFWFPPPRKFKTPDDREAYESAVYRWQMALSFVAVGYICFQYTWDYFYLYDREVIDWLMFFTQRPPFQLMITYYFIYEDGLWMILSILSFPVRPILRILSQEDGEPPYVGFTVEPNDKDGNPKDPIRLEREQKVGMKWAWRKRMLSYSFAFMFFSIFMWSVFMITICFVFGFIFYIWLYLILFFAFNFGIPVLMYINSRYIKNEKENEWFQFQVPEEIRKKWDKVRLYHRVQVLYKGASKYYFDLWFVQFFYIWQIWFVYTSMHILGFWVVGGLQSKIGYTDGVLMLLSAEQWDQLYARMCEHTYVTGFQLVARQPDCLKPFWKVNPCDIGFR